MTVLEKNPFRRALDGWDRAHWTKGHMLRAKADGSFAYCSLGRLDHVDRTTSFANRRILASVVPGWYRAVESYNDAASTTWHDIVSLFARAAQIWDEKERCERAEERRERAEVALREAQEAVKAFYVYATPPAPFELDMPENWAESWSHSADLTVPLDRELVSV